MFRIGNMTKALAALTALHAALDETRPRDTEELQGIFKIPIQGPAELPGSILWIPIKWMSFSQVYCLTYLLSGICHKADLTQPMKAQEFLVEGIKVVDREFNVNDYVFMLKFEMASAEDVKELVAIVKTRYPSGLPANIQCALHILDSWISVGVIPARQHLQESLRLSNTLQNTQMRGLTLLLLGHSHDDQAERMLSVAFSHAIKTGNMFIASASGSCLQELYLKTAQGIKASQQAELNKQVTEDVDKAFQTTILAPLLEPVTSSVPPS
ncbi:hypothetical protein BGW42_001051 [Actinomortierella wolfii]|nr:hypothetical protein BGW42_001051 [Actinomortierella wolfii]